MASPSVSGDKIANPPELYNNKPLSERELKHLSTQKAVDSILTLTVNAVDAIKSLNDDRKPPKDRSANQHSVDGPTSITGVSAGTIGDELSTVVWQRILVDFPWMKTDAITDMAQRCGTVITNSIVEQ